MLEAAVRDIDAFIAPSRFCRDIHFERGMNIPIMHLPSFVPSGDDPPAIGEAHPETLKGPYFLFVGRLEKLKGLQTLIPLFRDGYRKARLLVAGDGTYERRLRELAQGSRNIHFLGYLEHEKLWSLYKKAIAVIVPSLCYDILPLVVIEAFTQGTPAIVRDLGGTPELIEDSGGGCVYRTDAEILSAMDRLAQDASYRNVLGERGFQAYREKWSEEVHVRRYLELIDRVTSEKRREDSAEPRKVNR